MREPTPDECDDIRERLMRLGTPVPGSPDEVVVILCASRSGSSTTFRALRRSRDVVAPPGELEPYLNLTGTARGPDGSHNSREPSPRVLQELRGLARRDLWQWRATGIEPEQWRMRRVIQWPKKDFMGSLVTPQKMMGMPGVDEGCYDGAEDPTQPPVKVEEPPYVRPQPCKQPESLGGKTVLLKTPQHVYRRWIKELFPEAPVRTLHLTRNPAASINGLIDGWLHPHFTSHPGGPDFADWWSFDLPVEPGRMEGLSLPELAMLQWCEGNRSALFRNPDHTIQFEQLIAQPTVTLSRLCEEFGIQPPEQPKLPQVMSTEEPDPERWREREGLIKNVCQRSPVQELLDQLPYNSSMPWKSTATPKTAS